MRDEHPDRRGEAEEQRESRTALRVTRDEQNDATIFVFARVSSMPTLISHVDLLHVRLDILQLSPSVLQST